MSPPEVVVSSWLPIDIVVVVEPVVVMVVVVVVDDFRRLLVVVVVAGVVVDVELEVDPVEAAHASKASEGPSGTPGCPPELVNPHSPDSHSSLQRYKNKTISKMYSTIIFSIDWYSLPIPLGCRSLPGS